MQEDYLQEAKGILQSRGQGQFYGKCLLSVHELLVFPLVKPICYSCLCTCEMFTRECFSLGISLIIQLYRLKCY